MLQKYYTYKHNGLSCFSALLTHKNTMISTHSHLFFNIMSTTSYILSVLIQSRNSLISCRYLRARDIKRPLACDKNIL